MKHTFEKIRIEQERKAREKKQKRRWRTFAGILLILQTIASGYLFQKAFALDMLPGRLIFALGGILFILLAVNYLLYFAGAKKTGARTFRRFIAILLTLTICTGAVYVGNVMGKVNTTIKQITLTEKENYAAVMDVYVLANDPAADIAGCKDYPFGVTGGNDGPASFAAVTKINSETGAQINAKDYPSSTQLAGALYSGEVKAIIINHNYVDILGETDGFANFEDKTRLVETVNITPEELAQAESSNPFTAAHSDDKPVDIEPATSKVASVELEPFIVYISGSDTRDKMFQISRSDVNILMAVNPQTKQILLLNTPRDYYVPNPRSSYGTKDKLTHLGIYGVDCSITGLENLYGCDINYYVQINFTGTETLIDDLGGITINNPQSFRARGYSFPSGEITLNGPQAVVFARERYAFASGDNMRGQNQMRLITAIIKKLTSPNTALILNYHAILSDLEGFIVTNMESEEIENLVKMQLNDLATWNIKTYAATGYGGYDTTYSMPGTNLYVTYPYMSTVEKGSDLVEKVLTGGILTDEDVAD